MQLGGSTIAAGPVGFEGQASAFPAAGTKADQFRFLLGYAILAPSNHNTQPWLFDLYEDHVDLLADRTRSLRASDPFDRELVISCGAALACLQAAAAAFGGELAVDRFPEADNDDLLARVALKRKFGTEIDRKTLAAILNRRTNRKAFEPIAVSSQQREAIDSAMQRFGAQTAWIDKPHEREQLAQIIMDADRIQFENSAFLRELAAWIRPPQASAHDGIPAKAIGISGFASYVAPLVIRTFDLGDSRAARDEELMQGSPGVLVVSTPTDGARDWLACGEGLGFALLAAEALGLKTSYLNQPCQVSNLRFRLSLFEGVKGNPQLILRFGRAPAVAPTPRRALEDVVRDIRKRPLKD